MLKNKWLALGLSALALVLIAYRIFFDRSDSRPPLQNLQPLVTEPGTPERGQPVTGPDLEWTDPSGELLLDLDSPLLQKRVTPSPELLQPYEPISPRFGIDIFVGPSPRSSEAQAEEAVEPLQLELNGIVMDGSRRLAIVNRQLVQVGDFVGAARITGIDPGRVTYRLNGVEGVLELSTTPLRRLNEGG